MEDLREERDRFVAFAFAAADLLVEIEPSGTIRFVSGAAQALLDVTAAEMACRDFREFVDPADLAFFERLLTNIADHGRIEPVALKLRRRGGAPSRIMIGGCSFPGRKQGFFLSLSHLPSVPMADPAARDAETGLLTTDAFGEAALRHAAHADNSQMVMLQLGGLAALEGGLVAEARDKLRDEVAALLRNASIGGDMAARVDRETFSLVQKRGEDVAELSFGLKTVAQSADPDTEISVASAIVNLDMSEIGDQDAGRALAYCIKNFAETKGSGFGLSSLAGGFSAMVNQTMARVTEMRTVLEQGAFSLAYQPIVDLASGKLRHFEVLARFAPGQSPFELVAFSERIGLAEELDLAVCEKALKAARSAVIPENIALNLSGRSILSASFLERLMSMIDALVREPKRVTFEITESAAIEDLDRADAAIQALRDRGHPLCLDDFGAGFCAYTYLRRFAVDHIKFDGLFLKSALRNPRDAALVRSVAQLCRELKCSTIGEMLETEPEVRAAIALGLELGQGYYFGRPAPVPRYDG
ncbi:MAG TPA: EAL domain-containing protein [Aliidongia sp.]|nr:EAL domain-containing protein [Aliidongia sp.]